MMKVNIFILRIGYLDSCIRRNDRPMLAIPDGAAAEFRNLGIAFKGNIEEIDSCMRRNDNLSFLV
jgi:hypothetical protein